MHHYLARLYLALAVMLLAAPGAAAESRPPSVRPGVGVGVGLPVLWAVGPRLQIAPPFEVGAFYSSIADWDIWGGDASVHFGRTGDRPRPPIYMRLGFFRATESTPDHDTVDTIGTWSIGYEWFFGTHVALELDGGLATTLSHKVTHKKPRQTCDPDTDWFCGLGQRVAASSADTLPSLHVGLVFYL